MSEEYQRGYEQGIKDFVEKIANYYNALPGNTFGALVAYTIDLKAKEMLKGENDSG